MINETRREAGSITMCDSKEDLVQLGEVEAARCHRDTSQVAPSEEHCCWTSR